MTKTTTGERLVKIETSLDYLTDKIDDISESLKDHITREGENYESMQGRFAAKWVEKGIVAVGIAVVAFLIQQVIVG